LGRVKTKIGALRGAKKHREVRSESVVRGNALAKVRSRVAWAFTLEHRGGSLHLFELPTWATAGAKALDGTLE
jgi:hypothetical protein